MDANERLRRVGEEAADWWTLLQGGDLTREEREAFVDWLRDSPTNIAEMLRLAQVHRALDHFRDWSEIANEPGRDADIIPLPAQHRPGAPAGEQQGAKRTRSASTLKRLTLAATVAALALVSLFVVLQWRGHVITTERAERREVVLEDGSVVNVDPQTSLTVQFDKATRRVLLERGRAVFRVARNAQWPFIVQANDTTVRAVGTAFGVERRAGGVVVVTVAEGKVAVTGASAEAPRPDDSLTSPEKPDGAANRDPVYLTADQQITVSGLDATGAVRAISSARELAWAEGRLIFRNDPVEKVVAEFNRYNPVQMSVSDAALAARPISGVFDATKPEAFIAFIQSAASVRIERQGTRSIVISPAESRAGE